VKSQIAEIVKPQSQVRCARLAPDGQSRPGRSVVVRAAGQDRANWHPQEH
jgi:hypothetical protein